MTEMSMNKAIHGAFRRDLGRFARALEAFTPGDTTRAKRLGEAWAQFEDQLTHHHTGEHEIAWPALKEMGVSPDVLAQMDAEHDVMAAALADVHDAFAALERDPRQEQATVALSAVRQLETVTVKHLEHEEAELEPHYLGQKDHPQMKAMGKKFAKVSPARGGRFFAWVTDGATADELAAVKGNVPGPVLAIISGIFGRGYRKNIATVWTS